MKHNWEYKKLGEVAEIQYGYPFDSTFFNEDKDGLPLVRIRDVVRGYSETYFKGDYPKEYIVSMGDYLIGMDGEFNIAQWKSNDALLNQRVCKISIKDNKQAKMQFLYYFLTRHLKEIEDETPFVTVKHLSAKRINQIFIPLPPLPIQQKIVAELDKVCLIIDKKRQQLKELDNLAQAIFYDMFGDPDEIFTKWNYLTLEEVCLNIVDCPHTTPIKSETPTKYPCIRTSELKNGTIHWDTMQYVSEDEYNNRISRLIPQNGDIVYGREGSFGDAVILPYGWYFCLGQRTMLFRANCDIVNIIFLHRVLISEVVFRQAKDKNVASTVAHVNVKDIKKFLIPLPPLSLQQSFATKIEAIEKQKELISRSIKEAQTLFDERMDYWFD